MISIVINKSRHKNIDNRKNIDEKGCVDKKENSTSKGLPFYLTEKARKHGITRNLIEMVKNAPDLMEEKTEKIKKLVEQGKYHVDISKMINKMTLA